MRTHSIRWQRIAQQYITQFGSAGELAPNYQISENIREGFYYLYGRDFDAGDKNTHFVTASVNLTRLHVVEGLNFNMTP